jgi:CRISPR/Cas system-associated endoribonuclease Cas2
LQFSGFWGDLDRQKRQELINALKLIVGDNDANLYIQPICGTCLKYSFAINNKKQASKEEAKPAIYFGMKLNRNYQNYQD